MTIFYFYFQTQKFQLLFHYFFSKINILNYSIFLQYTNINFKEKNIKKITILISLFLITSALAYSHSLDVGLYVPLGGSIPSLYQNDNLSLSPKSAFEVGVIFNPRVTFDVNDYNDISIGVDIGWYRDTFKFQTASQNFTHEFDNVMVGLNFRWSPSLFVLGIGGGVKFPFTGQYWEGNNKVSLSDGINLCSI
ncbi:hypothetical protein H263_03838 [Brachyspira hampsonii 30599]|nr:hypothetical protein H263_03838 [Brachyspira hampsonii 30599]